jgi:hypothetical protein
MVSTRPWRQGHRRALFAIRRRADIIGRQENYRSFLDIYDFVQATFGARRAAKALRSRV